MSRILTGVQSTGRPHLGNILGAIIPAIELANKKQNDSFLFIADLHSCSDWILRFLKKILYKLLQRG